MANQDAFYQAFVEIVPEGTRLRKETARLFDAVGADGGKRAGSGLGGGLLGATRSIAGPIAGILGTALSGAAIYGAFKGGVSRLLNIEDAQAKLAGLGHSTETVGKIMENALSSVKGTAFGLDEAATIAASAVAAGVKPGQELERYLTLTADAAALAGGSLSELGNVFNNVTTVGAAYNDSLQIIAQKGIPIYQYLSDQLGISTADVKQFASEGKISAEDFQRAIETNIGGSALSAGNTTRGAFDNMLASLNRVAANLLSGVFPMVKTAFQGITDALAPLEAAAKVAGETLGSVFISAGADIKGALAGVGPILASIAAILSPFLATIAASFAPLIPQLIDFASSFSIVGIAFQAIGPLLPELVSAFAGLAKTLSGALGSALTTLLPVIQALSGILITVLGQVIAALLPVITQLVAVIGPLLTTVLNAIMPIIVLVAGVIGQLLTAVAPLVTAILALVAPLVQLVASILGPLIELFAAILTPILGLVSTLVSLLIPVIQFLVTALTAVIGVIVAIIQWFVDLVTGAGTAGDDLLAFFTGLPDMILGALGDLGTFLVDAGKDLIQGFIDGISSMIGGIGDAIGGAMDFVGGFFPHSPAKRGPFSGSGWKAVKDAGLAIGDQFGVGLTSAEPALNAQLGSMLSAPVSPTLDASVYGASSGATSATGGPQIVMENHYAAGLSESDVTRLNAEKLTYALRGI